MPVPTVGHISTLPVVLTRVVDTLVKKFTVSAPIPAVFGTLAVVRSLLHVHVTLSVIFTWHVALTFILYFAISSQPAVIASAFVSTGSIGDAFSMHAWIRVAEIPGKEEKT